MASRVRRWRIAVVVLIMGVLAMLAPTVWLRAGAANHIHAEKDAPAADVVIVFGARVTRDGKRPTAFLAGRLDTTIALVQAGKARAVLVSGDGRHANADQVAVMTRYLIDRGVPRSRIVTDPHGLDTYDTCRRAREVYGVDRALLVSQEFHLPRAVTLCRHFGIDADGVAARCDGCASAMPSNKARELPAAVKAALDVLRDRPPAVRTPPQPEALRDALRS